MDLYKPPCDSSEILNYNITLEFKNLLKYINFYDTFNVQTQNNINNINFKIRNMEDLEKEIKEMFIKVDSFKAKIEGLENTIYNHQTKILSIEANSKDQVKRLDEIDISFLNIDKKLEVIDNNLISLNKITSDNTKDIDKLRSKTNQLDDLTEKHTNSINLHHDNINFLMGDIEIMKTLENKLKQKIKRQKATVKFKIRDIDLLIDSLMKKQETLISISKKGGGNQVVPIVLNQSSEVYQGNMEAGSEISNFMEKTSRSFQIFDEELKNLKKLISTNKSFKNSLKADKIETNLELKYELLFNDIRDKIKIIGDLLGNKINREELEKSNLMLLKELDKVNQKLFDIPKQEENQSSNVTQVENEENKALIKKMHEVIAYNQKQNEETFNKFQLENESKIAEINKLYESVCDLRKQLTEITNDTKGIDMKELPFKLIDLQENINTLKVLVEGLAGAGGGEIFDSDSKGEAITMRDVVSNTIRENKVLSEKVEKIFAKVEGFNSEVLLKIRKELMNESGAILDNFRSDLKSNLLKIEEQMRDKVDKLNMDELIRKFDQKIVSEVSRKLDRNDMKRNNNVINKKIDVLENKISRTLVDTLIDMQLEDAPLIIKQGIKGEKCASCNQNINPHSHYNHNDVSSSTTFKKMIFNTEKKKDDINVLKSSTSALNLNFLPEIPSIIQNNNNLNTIKNRKTISIDKSAQIKYKRNFNKTINDSLTVQYYDGDAEKSNNIVNDELEKFVIKPDNIMRANNKIFEKNYVKK